MAISTELHPLYRALRCRPVILRRVPAASFHSSRKFTTSNHRQGDLGPDRDHVLDKTHKTEANVQSDASVKGREHRAMGAGGAATQQKDVHDQKRKILNEHPEAPDTIGMQDERGSKGGS